MALDAPGLIPQSAPQSGSDGNQSAPDTGAGPAHESRAQVRPEGLPEQYWDEKAGLKTADLVKDFNEAVQYRTDQSKALGEVPEKADGYKLPEKLLPDDFKLPEGVEFKLDANHPLIAAAQAVFHEMKAPPALFGKLAQTFAKYQVETELAQHKAMSDATAEQKKKLGGNADARIGAVTTFVNGLVGEKLGRAILAQAFSADFIVALEEAQKKFSSQSNIVPFNQTRDETTTAQPQSIESRWYGNSQKAS